jgi:hypothetical protein
LALAIASPSVEAHRVRDLRRLGIARNAMAFQDVLKKQLRDFPSLLQSAASLK